MTREDAIHEIRNANVTLVSKEAKEIAIKALEQEPCEVIKEIPKDYAYDTETQGFEVYRHKYTGHEIHIEKSVPRYKLEQEPCEDAISRKATLEKFKKTYFDDRTVIRCAELVLGGMPSVQLQQRMGHWIEDRCDMYICSECNNTYTDLSGERYGMHYCPNCGAKMQ